MRRLCFGLWLALLLAACGGGEQAGFANTDITGVDYGRRLELTDHGGQQRRLEDYRGKVVALFFGFTQCPDVCPTTLTTMAEVMRRLGEDAARVQVLFVTVDPERDTPQVLAEYVPTFHPSFLGLYGDAAATLVVAREFKVFYQKVPSKEPDAYTMDHTAATYLIDPQGRLRLYVRHGERPEAIVADIRRLLGGA